MLEIRKADKSQINLIHELGSRIFAQTYAEMLSKEQIEYMVDMMYSLPSLQKQFDNSDAYFIPYCDGEAAGYLSIGRESEDSFHLHKIYLDKKYHGRGFGKILFQCAIDYVKSFKLPSAMLRLNVNRDNKAVNFYEKMGMKKLSKGDFAIGCGYYMTDFIMGIEIKC